MHSTSKLHNHSQLTLSYLSTLGKKLYLFQNQNKVTEDFIMEDF